MAVTKIHRITTTLIHALDYIENKNKTDDNLLITGYGCSPEIAAIEFEQVRRNAMKPGGTLAFHLIQSFAPGEVDYDTAHKIGVELADKVLKNRFQYVVATHIDKDHIHNHIIFNSVSFTDYKKFHCTASVYRYIKRHSDVLCSENGLSVITIPQSRGKSHYEHLLDKKGQSWKSKLRQTIDYCILKSRSWDEFLMLMDKEKYEIKYGKYISFRAEGQERFTRSKALGDHYTEESIRKRIAGEYVRLSSKEPDIRNSLVIDIENNIKAMQSKGYANWAKVFNLKLVAETVNYLSENNISDISTLDAKISELSDKLYEKKEISKANEKRIKVLEEQIKDIEVYRKTKPVVEGVPKHFGKEKYRHEHEAEFILYAAAERSIKKAFGGKKLPLIKELRAEQKKLRTEADKLWAEIKNERPQLDELRKMKNNIDRFLNSGKQHERSRNRKRSDELE